MRLEGLVIRGYNRDHGVHYQPSDPDKVCQVLHDLDAGFGAGFEAATFVDIGSGKGRVVLVASTLPFMRVVGVEFSEDLDRIARENLSRFPAAEQCAGQVELLCMDRRLPDRLPDPGRRDGRGPRHGAQRAGLRGHRSVPASPAVATDRSRTTGPRCDGLIPNQRPTGRLAGHVRS